MRIRRASTEHSAKELTRRIGKQNMEAAQSLFDRMADQALRETKRKVAVLENKSGNQ